MMATRVEWSAASAGERRQEQRLPEATKKQYPELLRLESCFNRKRQTGEREACHRSLLGTEEGLLAVRECGPDRPGQEIILHNVGSFLLPSVSAQTGELVWCWIEIWTQPARRAKTKMDHRNSLSGYLHNLGQHALEILLAHNRLWPTLPTTFFGQANFGHGQVDSRPDQFWRQPSTGRFGPFFVGRNRFGANFGHPGCLGRFGPWPCGFSVASPIFGRARPISPSAGLPSAGGQTCTFEVPTDQNTTKIPQEDPQREEKRHEKIPREKERMKMGAEKEKKREILDTPPFGPPPFLGSGPHPSGPHLFWVWVPTLSGPPPLHAPTPSGPHPPQSLKSQKLTVGNVGLAVAEIGRAQSRSWPKEKLLGKSGSGQSRSRPHNPLHWALNMKTVERRQQTRL